MMTKNAEIGLKVQKQRLLNLSKNYSNMAITDFGLKAMKDLFADDSYFIIPKFQRDYSWDISYYGQFWDDLIKAINENLDYYFFGTFFFMTPNIKNEIIDGQQRIVTFSLLMSAISDVLANDGNIEQSNRIKSKYVASNKDLFSTNKIRKLELGDLNDSFFNKFILNDEVLGKKVKLINGRKAELKDSNRKLAECYLFFVKSIQDKLLSLASKKEKEAWIETLFTKVTSGFQVMTISVKDENEAYLIFETLNDRGLDLSLADLLKNYLFRTAKESLRDVQKEWQELIDTLSNKDINVFIRQYWISKYNQVGEKELFKELKSKISTPQSVLNFVRELNSEAEVYDALKNPSEEYFKKDIAYSLKDLNCLSVKQIMPLLLSAQISLKESEFEKVIRLCESFTFRFITIAHFNNKELESLYGDIARKIRNKNITLASQVKDLLIKKYVSDEEFIPLFLKAEFNTNKLIKYFFEKIENLINPNGEFGISHKNISIEHILPKNPNEAWKVYMKKHKFESDSQELVAKIGNLTLLNTKMNNLAGNKFFSEKQKDYYKESKLKINESLKNLVDWTPKELRERQIKLSEYAKEIWKI